MFLTRPPTAAKILANTSRQLACNRTFFTPPPLPSFFSSPSDEPQTYHERKLFPCRYRPSQLYQVVSDVASYPKFIPYCTKTRILSRSTAVEGDASVVKMDAEMTVSFMTFEASYISNVKCGPNEYVEAVAASSSPIFKSLTTTWRFQPASPRSPHASNATALSTPIQPAGPPGTSSEHNLTLDSGPTLVSLDLSFLFAHAAYAGASQLFFGQVSRMMVSAFENRCLELYGPGNR